MNTPPLTADPTTPVRPVATSTSSFPWQPASQFTASTQGNETVLVVDDEPLLREAMAYTLRQLGYGVLEAPGAVEAQHLAETNQTIHLLITDFSMPETDGVELAHWFQARFPKTKVLIATGSLWNFVSHVGEQEPFALLVKPFDRRQLSRMVRLLLDKAQPSPQRGFEEPRALFAHSQ